MQRQTDHSLLFLSFKLGGSLRSKSSSFCNLFLVFRHYFLPFLYLSFFLVVTTPSQKPYFPFLFLKIFSYSLAFDLFFLSHFDLLHLLFPLWKSQEI